MKQYYVYIMTNHARTLYIGVTNNLSRRVSQHKQKVQRGFTARYSLDKLVYYEVFNDVRAAIAREKQIKGWKRERKIAMIEENNPECVDLLV